MKLVYDDGYYLVTDLHTATEPIIVEAMMGRPCLHHGSLAIYILESEESIKYSLLANDWGLHASCYLDRFILVSPRDDIKRKQIIMDSFFALIAKQYEELIDVERNKENIRYLLTYLNIIPFKSDSIVLDFGCGTGISAEVWRDMGQLNGRLIGLDRCSKMRQIATGRGMEVWGPHEMVRLHPGTIDRVFASYVFHLISNVHSIRLLWSRLKPGGVIVANFHKNQGIQMVSEHLEIEAQIINPVPGLPENSCHGAYVAYKKK
jgi:ubiquinone/menaquinone biosynthesis C-methylase UbiE